MNLPILDLKAGDFAYASNYGQSGQYWPVFSWTCPKGQQAIIPAATAILLYLCTQDKFLHAGSGAEVVELTHPAADCAGDITDGGDFVAIGELGARVPVSSVDFTDSELTLTSAAADEIDVTYRPRIGGVRLAIVVPSMGNRSTTIFEGDMGSLHTRDQYDSASRIALDRAYGMAADWQLQIQVRSLATITPSAPNQTVKIPVVLTPAKPGFASAALQLLG